MKKEEKEYVRLTLYFKTSNRRQMDAFRFLNMITRRCTNAVTELVINYLERNGISNVNRLTKKEADELIQDPNSFKCDTKSSVSGDLYTLLSMFAANNNVIAPEQNKENTGRFKKREEKHTEPESYDEKKTKPDTGEKPKEKNIVVQEKNIKTENEDYQDDDGTYDVDSPTYLASTWENGLDMFDS